MAKITRRPPKHVRADLRKEVGFGCPVPECGCPFLEWHHFSPTWAERPHHDVAGMVALCPIHHRQADAGAYTQEQIIEFKRNGCSEQVRGRLSWLRNDLVTIIGNNYYYECSPVILAINTVPVVSVSRDADMNQRLNIAWRGPEARVQIEDHDFLEIGKPTDMECPPSGKLLRVEYENGDMIKIEFFEVADFAMCQRRLRNTPISKNANKYLLSWPLTFMRLSMKSEFLRLQIDQRGQRQDDSLLANSFFYRTQAREGLISISRPGLSIGVRSRLRLVRDEEEEPI